MSKYKSFIFSDYQFSPDDNKLDLSYEFEGGPIFSETFNFDFPFAKYEPAVLDRALQMLFFMAGISYYKTYLSPKIVINKGQIDEATAEFLAKTYQRGLGEFFYVNKLEPNTKIPFRAN